MRMVLAVNRGRSPNTPTAASLPGEPSSPGLSPDDRLEAAIEATRQALLGAKTAVMRRALAEQMRQLIGQRSPWRIAQMERERGLR